MIFARFTFTLQNNCYIIKTDNFIGLNFLWSDGKMINQSVKKLICYGLEKQLFEKRDEKGKKAFLRFAEGVK